MLWAMINKKLRVDLLPFCVCYLTVFSVKANDNLVIDIGISFHQKFSRVVCNSFNHKCNKGRQSTDCFIPCKQRISKVIKLL